MKAEEFMELMNTLPDEMIASAVRSEPQRSHRTFYVMTSIAACLVVGIAAAVYPKLRTQKPEIAEPFFSVTSTVTTTATKQSQTATSIQTTVDNTTKPTTSTAQTTAIGKTETTITKTVTLPETDVPVLTQTEPTAMPITETVTESIISTTEATIIVSETEPLTTQTTNQTSQCSAQAICMDISYSKDAMPTPYSDKEIPSEQYQFEIPASSPKPYEPSDTPSYDQVLVMIYTHNADISLTGGTLDTENKRFMLTADCLLSKDEDSPLWRYEFWISVPSGVLDNDFSFDVTFNYQAESEYVGNTENMFSLQIL